MNEIDTPKNCTTSERFSSSIEKLMELRGINMSQLHKHTGVPLTTINRMVNEKNVNPTISTLIPIADYFGITLNQLMGLDPLKPNSHEVTYSNRNIQWTEVPLIDWQSSTNWVRTNPKPTVIETISTDAIISKDSFALIINETNLEGFIRNSVIIVDPNAIAEHGDYVVITKSGQDISSLKQILIDDDLTYIRPLNKNFQTRIKDESYKIIGVVSQIRMDRKYNAPSG